MKFKSDSHRKAVFANMFNRKGKNTRVNVSSVVNTEIKSMKSTQVKLPKIKGTKMRNQDVKLKDIKATKEFCRMCKREGLKLTDRRCKACVREENKFKKEKRPKHSEILKLIERDSNPKTNMILSEVKKLINVFAHINGSDLRWMWREYDEKVEGAKKEVRKGDLPAAKIWLREASNLLWRTLEIQVQETRLEAEVFWSFDEWEEFT